jgi:hypothetical protein
VDHARIRAEYRYAHDIVFSFEADRDLALKREVTNAVEFLYRLQPPPRAFENPAANFVERERQRAARDVMAYLRLKTGRDLGDDPEAWILAYGDENLKMNQGARAEMADMTEQVRKGNYGRLIQQLNTNK